MESEFEISLERSRFQAINAASYHFSEWNYQQKETEQSFAEI